MLCSVLKCAKLSTFNGVHFEVHLRVLILYLPKKNRYFIVVTVVFELPNTYSLTSYLTLLINNYEV